MKQVIINPRLYRRKGKNNMNKWTDEMIIVAMEILSYIASKKESNEKISLRTAYEEKGVSEELQLSKQEIEEISKELLNWCAD